MKEVREYIAKNREKLSTDLNLLSDKVQYFRKIRKKGEISQSN